MDVHKTTNEEIKHRLPRGDEIDSFPGQKYDKLQDNRALYYNEPLPELPVQEKIKE